MKRAFFLVFLIIPVCRSPLAAEDLFLLRDGKSDYQIVLPDQGATPALENCLAQTARLLQSAFQANGAQVPVVAESQRDTSRPALLLGNTAFARNQGVDVSKFKEWSYIHRAFGRDIVIAGNDQPARAGTDNPRRPNWDRVATAKAAADFARQFMGVRFLYPELASYTPVSGAAKIDLLASPALEFLPMKDMAAPQNLNASKTPLLRLNTAHPAGGSFYDLAHNRFPRIDEQFGSHTWERAVPAELFAEHPEYFALVNGTRLSPQGGNAQYCLSNPEVRERIYRDIAAFFDQGYASVDLGQPDGFRECQCEKCEALYGTGRDWSEKIWIFNRETAERLAQSHPGGQVTMMSYILTAQPPRTFSKFPENTSIMLTGTNEEDIAPWRDIAVPRGFTGYVYNWCPNLGTRYTPMRTPGYIELQVKRLAANKVQALLRDGPGQLFGLEGPVYYTMGRMFDDPENNHARDLVAEFCEGAFPDKSIAFYMRAFYDELYNAIALYSDHLGTRNDLWTYKLLPTDQRGRKTITDPFRLITFLYTPQILSRLETHLAQSESLARTPKIKSRLALVRDEFDYLNHLARVAHLHQAYLVTPDAGSRDRLLDAIDQRNAHIESLFKKGRQTEWNHVLFPFPGHDAKHLRLAYDGYQEPYANTCYNWDTEAMRQAPAPGLKKLTVASTAAEPTIDSPEWNRAAAHELSLLPPFHSLPRRTQLRLLYDDKALYILAVAETGDGTEFPAFPRDRDLSRQEAFDLLLAPNPSTPLLYHFAQGPNPASRYDALNGAISDVMDPRHGKDDPSWNGEWTSEVRIDKANKQWRIQVTIPFATLGVPKPEKNTAWRANFGRNHLLPRDAVDRAIWSSSPAITAMADPSGMGEIVFD